MSTRSTVWCEFEDENGKTFYRGSYCHFDGYLRGVGLSLFRYFEHVDWIRKVIDDGDIRSIDHQYVEHFNGGYRECSRSMETYDKNEIIELNPQEYNYLYLANDDKDLGKKGWKIFWNGSWKDLSDILYDEGLIRECEI